MHRFSARECFTGPDATTFVRRERVIGRIYVVACASTADTVLLQCANYSGICQKSDYSLNSYTDRGFIHRGSNIRCRQQRRGSSQLLFLQSLLSLYV